jgi:hypothetical protein
MNAETVETVETVFATAHVYRPENVDDARQLAWQYLLSRDRHHNFGDTAERMEAGLCSLVHQADRQLARNRARDNATIRNALEFDRLTRDSRSRHVEQRSAPRFRCESPGTAPATAPVVDDESLSESAELFVCERAESVVGIGNDGTSCPDWQRLVTALAVNSAVLANGASYLTWNQAESQLTQLELEELETVLQSEYSSHSCR